MEILLQNTLGTCIATEKEFCGAHIHVQTSWTVEMTTAAAVAELAGTTMLCVGRIPTPSFYHFSVVHLRVEDPNYGN
jgi:hypothetical protein